MYCLSACHVLLYMMLYQQTSVVYLQTLTLTIETSPLVHGADVRLKCLYSGPTCCTDDARVWTRDGTDIMNNGASSNIAKYKEERNDAGLHFDMKILNLDDSDFGKVFQCQYNFKSSNTVTLTKDSTYESPPRTELCPFTYDSASPEIRITGTLNITKAAPSPVLTSYYGEDNLTPDLSTTGVSNYDTWYYTLTISIDTRMHCCGHRKDKFKLYAITGTTSTKICDIDMCECLKCFRNCFLVNWSFGILGIILSMVYCIFCGEECEKQKLIKMTVVYGIITVILSLIVGLTMGLHGCICNEGYFWLFAFVTSIVCGCIAIVITYLIFNKIDWSLFKDNKILIFLLVLGMFIGIAFFMFFNKWYKEIKAIIGENRRLPCPFADASGQITWVKLNNDDRVTYSEGTVLNQHLPQRLRERLNVEGRDLCISNVQASDTGTYECVFTSKKANKVPEVSKLKLIVSAGENSQSVESGSSCWPICRVGQDPNTSSSDSEKVRRSSKKESADKKPTGFVRPQPSRAQHLGTDNTGRAEYSAENEMYSEKLLKSNKPRLLPSIGQQTDSPRPLPQMPASAQQGGNQLAPLEKKKKKRKKKREAKQSDENSTEL